MGLGDSKQQMPVALSAVEPLMSAGSSSSVIAHRCPQRLCLQQWKDRMSRHCGPTHARASLRPSPPLGPQRPIGQPVNQPLDQSPWVRLCSRTRPNWRTRCLEEPAAGRLLGWPHATKNDSTASWKSQEAQGSVGTRACPGAAPTLSGQCPARFRRRVAESPLASPLGSERLPSKTHGGYCWWFASR
jgi:hypothetical protein